MTMNALTEILVGVSMFTGVIILLVGVILLAKKSLIPSGHVKILVNGVKEISVPQGARLPQARRTKTVNCEL